MKTNTPFRLFAAFTVMLLASHAFAQKHAKTNPELLPPTKLATPKYYNIVGLGSSEHDPSIPLPHPTAMFQLHDTAHVRLVVRFPGLGLLGNHEDTVSKPSVNYPDTMVAYQSPEPMMQLTAPQLMYHVVVEVRDRATNKILDSRSLPYSMDVKKYFHKPIKYLHPATAGYGNKTLRRAFAAKLLPLDIETNPGWNGTEELDSLGTYVLGFKEPPTTGTMTNKGAHLDSNSTILSITIRPVEAGATNKKDWEKFKKSARESFGAKGIAVTTLQDFQVTDPATRKVIRSGYEFVAKEADDAMKYVATLLTPHALILLVAPLDDDQTMLSYEYVRAIARSFKIPAAK